MRWTRSEYEAYCRRRGVPSVASAFREPDQATALDKNKKPRSKSKGPVFRVTFIVLRRRLLDSDNGIGGLKGVRDEVARTLKLDDADDQIKWEYQQCKTEGEPGTLIKIEVI